MKIIVFSLLMAVLLMLTACMPTVPTSIPSPTVASVARPSSTKFPTQVPAASAGTGQKAVVAYVGDGDILVWDEATGQRRTVFDSGDAILVRMSDDGQVIAFLRRFYFEADGFKRHEQSALWAVDLNGENPRELVSVEELRRLLNAAATDSTNLPQMEWIPGTHRLLYTAWTYFVVAEGESHATPAGLYLVDADTLTNSVLLPADGNHLQFSPSPDGQHIALISTTGLGFINADGSDHQLNVFPYAHVGMAGQAFPVGVWTWDARAFLLATYLEKTPQTDPGLAIWRVPLVGAPERLTDPIIGSGPSYISFSPDGGYAAFFRHMGGPSLWSITPLAGEAGPLAIPKSSSLFWTNPHWSPAGAAYAFHKGSLVRLCPGAAQEVEVCSEVLALGDPLAEIVWLDEGRFFFVTRDPYDLYFAKIDGTKIPIAEGVEKISAVAMTCRNASEFTPGGAGLAHASVAPDTLFQTTWRIRNAGTCTWDASYRLAFLSGERMGGPRGLPLGETVPPGGKIEFTVTLVSPAEVGAYQGQWQLFGSDGRPFGVRPTVDIVVPSYVAIDLSPDQIIAKIPGGGYRMAFAEGALWFLGGDSVTRVDPDTGQIAADIPVGQFAQSMTTGFGAVWASAGGGISRIDPQTDQVSAVIPFDPSFTLNGLATGAGSVWATNGSEGLVYRIDPGPNQVIAEIKVEKWASQIAALDDAIWVTNTASPILTRIDPATNEVSATIDLECSARWLVADASAVWVMCGFSRTLFRIDPLTNQIVARIAIGLRSPGLALGSNAVWVTSPSEDTLMRIDPLTSQVVAVYRVGKEPKAVIAVQDEIWVVMGGEGTVWRIRP
jgi:glutamine cyclotransferase